MRVSDNRPVDLKHAVHTDPHDQCRVPYGQIVEAGHSQVRVINEDNGQLLPLPVQLQAGYGLLEGHLCCSI